MYYDTDIVDVNDPSEKLHKVLARAGIGARREIETWIELGRVQVNGQVANLGKRVLPTDRIKIDNRPILIGDQANARRVIIYNKPEGEICTRNDPLGRKTVFTSLPRIRGGRWVSVGRLDINTTGLLLFTNDGELANLMMHPSSNLQREYAVRVFGDADEQTLERLRQGVMLEDGFARFESIHDAGGMGTNHWYHVIINEGRNREVRRLWESQDIRVNRLIRVRFAKIKLPRTLRVGQWIEMPDDEIAALSAELGLTGNPTECCEEQKTRRSNYIRSKKRMSLKKQRRSENAVSVEAVETVESVVLAENDEAMDCEEEVNFNR